MEIPISSDPQKPNPILDIPNTVFEPNQTRNIFKPLFFIFFGLFLIIAIISLYLLAKTNELISIPESTTQVIETTIPTAIPTIIDQTADWQTYSNETYKYSVKKPSTWGYDPQSIYKNETSFYVPSMDQCHHIIFCYQTFTEYKNEFFNNTGNQLEYSSLENLVTDQKNTDWKFISKTDINNQTFYKTKSIDMVESTSYFIENNQNKAFCRVDLCNNDQTEDNLFVFSFKFN